MRTHVSLLLAALIAAPAVWAAPAPSKAPGTPPAAPPPAAPPAASTSAAPAVPVGPNAQNAALAWEDYRLKTGAALGSLEDEINKLASDAKTVATTGRSDLQAEAESLRGKKHDVDQMFMHLDAANEETRKFLRPKIDAAVSELRGSLREARAKVKAAAGLK